MLLRHSLFSLWLWGMQYNISAERISGTILFTRLFIACICRCSLWGNEGMRFYSATPLNLYGYLLGTPYPWEDWLWLIYRVLIGCTGSLAIIALFHLPQYIPSWIQQVGTSTQAIYILQACLLEHFIGGFIAQKTAWLVPIQQLPPLCLFCVALPMIAISLVGLCVLVYRPMRRVPILYSLLFGTVPSCRK